MAPPIFQTLIVRRSKRMAGLNLIFASLVFGLGIAVVWYAVREGEALTTPLMFMALAIFWGVMMGQQFRDDAPKVIVGRDGLDLPGVSDGPIPWSMVEELAAGSTSSFRRRCSWPSSSAIAGWAI
jgi:hypothetical protein